MVTYTFWKARVGHEDDADLLKEEPIFDNRMEAFTKAQILAYSLKGHGNVILVRGISIDDVIANKTELSCDEWTFYKPTENN